MGGRLILEFDLYTTKYGIIIIIIILLLLLLMLFSSFHLGMEAAEL